MSPDTAGGSPAIGQEKTPSDRESGYRRQKRQLGEVRAALQQSLQSQATTDARFEKLEGMLERVLSGQGESNQNNRSTEMPLNDLRTMAVGELATEQPGAANEAMLRYFEQTIGALEKKIDEKSTVFGEDITKTIEQNVFGKMSLQQEERDSWADIQKDFGEIARDPKSELFQTADEIYHQLTAAHGARFGGESPVPATYKRQAFLEAERRLKQGESKETEKEPPSGSPGLPPGSQIETTGEGTAEAAAQQAQMLKDGNWEGSLKAKARNMYAE